MSTIQEWFKDVRMGEKRNFVLGKNETVEFKALVTIELLLRNLEEAQNFLRFYAPDLVLTFVPFIALKNHEHTIEIF